MLVAQITDFHVATEGSPFDVRFGTGAALARAVAHLGRLDPAPDAIVCTGDLVDGGPPDEYARLRRLLAPLSAPVYVLPGNHDHRDHLRAAFADRGYLPADGFLHYVVDLGPLRLVALDTLVPGAPGGRLCAERLAWLDARLCEAPDRPTLVVQHHPPFATGIAAMDELGLDGAADERAVLARHPQVERVLCGHLHRAITTRIGSTLASTCPSTTHQVALDLRLPGALALVPEPPACQLHTWRPDLGLVSHLAYLDDHGPRLELPRP